jgi:hypothetical protein
MMREDVAVERARRIFGGQLSSIRDRVRSGEVQRQAEKPEARPAPTSPVLNERVAPDDLAPAGLPRRTAPASPEAAELRVAQTTALEHGARAIDKILAGRDKEVTHEEAVGLEAIVLLTGRPALLIQDGKFFPAPAEWQVLEQHRSKIEGTLTSVGRIEVTGHPRYEWIGTGFLAGDDAVMTNRHVAVEFCRQAGGAKWGFITGIKPRIDFKEEFGSLKQAEYSISGVIGVHSVYDMALLKVTWKAGSAHPKALTVSSKPPKPVLGDDVYVVGYPAWDGRRNDPEPMTKIFSNIYNVKRLQPGKLMRLKGPIAYHDCSTLGGNSGSAVFDLQTQQIVGLHFSGLFQKDNQAVALWKLSKDPLLRKAKVNFV